MTDDSTTPETPNEPMEAALAGAADTDAPTVGPPHAGEPVGAVAPSQPAYGAAYSAASHESAASQDGPAPQYGVGPFSLREVLLGGVWLIAFVISFFPIYGQLGQGVTVWSNGIDWVLLIGVPTVAVFLLGLRRLSPDGIRRVGSLGIDQFASVAFSVSVVLWLGILWTSFISLAGQSVFLATWVAWVEFVLMLAGVVLTVVAPFIPGLRDDFRHRAEVVAHPVARPPRRITARPAPVAQPIPAAQDTPNPYAPNPYETGQYATGAYAPHQYETGQYETGQYATGSFAPNQYETGQYATGSFAPEQASATPSEGTATDAGWVAPVAGDAAQGADEGQHGVSTPAGDAAPAAEAIAEPGAQQASAPQAFWALVPEVREVVDHTGAALFAIGPTAWALVIEDRVDHYVVRHEDGRVGYLLDVSNVTRG